MTQSDTQALLAKYQDTIKEEINVKDVTVFAKDISISKIFKPL
jgi:hypothetical protein